MSKTLAELKPGDEVAVISWTGHIDGIAKIDRRTPTQIVVGQTRYDLNGYARGRKMSEHISLPTDEHRYELAERERRRAKEKRERDRRQAERGDLTSTAELRACAE